MADCNFIGPCMLRTEAGTCRNIGTCQHQSDINERLQGLMMGQIEFAYAIQRKYEKTPRRRPIGPKRAARNRVKQ